MKNILAVLTFTFCFVMANTQLARAVSVESLIEKIQMVCNGDLDARSATYCFQTGLGQASADFQLEEQLKKDTLPNYVKRDDFAGLLSSTCFNIPVAKVYQAMFGIYHFESQLAFLETGVQYLKQHVQMRAQND